MKTKLQRCSICGCFKNIKINKDICIRCEKSNKIKGGKK